jgi:esterase/lipase
MSENPATMKQVVEHAEKLVKDGRPHELMPINLSEDLLDAQRYLSLYTPDSDEEIFTYSQPNKIPTTFKKVKTPTLVILAEKDEYGDRPAKKIAQWFEKESKSTILKVEILRDSIHNLTKKETEVAQLIKEWVKTVKN